MLSDASVHLRVVSSNIEYSPILAQNTYLNTSIPVGTGSNNIVISLSKRTDGLALPNSLHLISMAANLQQTLTELQGLLDANRLDDLKKALAKTKVSNGERNLLIRLNPDADSPRLSLLNPAYTSHHLQPAKMIW